MRRDLGTRMPVGFFLLAALCGCTSAPLRRTTINQLGTVHDIYQQQVLDNLAMFVHNRGSYPYFSLIGTGTTTLTDMGTLADTNGWGRSAMNIFWYTSAGLNPTLSRQKIGSWATFPINDSVKLTVMRCVYQAALDGCLSAPGESCPDCENLFYAYYNIEPPTGSNSIPYHGGPSNDPMDPSNTPYYSGTPTQAAKDSPNIVTRIPSGAQDYFKGYTLQFETGDAYLVESSIPSGSAPNQTTQLVVTHPLIDDRKDVRFTLSQKKRPPIRGIVTPECLAFPQGWFCHGHSLPKHFHKCTPYGYYCGTYVWVPPDGIDQLTKLVLLIQDLAYYDPPLGPGQSVTTMKTTSGSKAGSSALMAMDYVSNPALDRVQRELYFLAAQTVTSQPTPSLLSAITQLLTAKKLQDEYAQHEKNREDRLRRLEMLRQIADQPEVSTQITTTTTTTPPSRRPSTFQPSILQLQQDLNLLPPRP